MSTITKQESKAVRAIIKSVSQSRYPGQDQGSARHQRSAKTDKYHDDMQASYKIMINSMYGFLGTAGLLFNSPKNAAFVTRKGREILSQAIKWASGLTYEEWSKQGTTESSGDIQDI